MDKKRTYTTLVLSLCAIVLLVFTVAQAAQISDTTTSMAENVVDETHPIILDSPVTTQTDKNEEPANTSKPEDTTQMPADSTTPESSLADDTVDTEQSIPDTSTSVTDEPIVLPTMEQADFSSVLFYDTSYEQAARIAKSMKRDTIKSMEVVCTYIDEETVSFTYDNHIFCLTNNGQWQLGMVIVMYFIV